MQALQVEVLWKSDGHMRSSAPRCAIVGTSRADASMHVSSKWTALVGQRTAVLPAEAPCRVHVRAAIVDKVVARACRCLDSGLGSKVKLCVRLAQAA